MTSLEEICKLLGHSWDGIPSKGRPGFIRGHLEQFSRDWIRMKDNAMLAKFFLSYHGKKLFSHPECRPKLPEHHDEIFGLVTEAFRLLQAQPVGKPEQGLQSKTSESIGTTGPQKIESPSEDGSHEVSAKVINAQPTMKSEEKSDDLPGTTTDVTITPNAPSPLVISSKRELVSMLKEWIDTHPNLRIPELAKYDRNSFENSFAMEASLTETNERIWIIRLGVIDLYQGWVLEKLDGSVVLVKAQYRKGGYVYYGWLGGDLGYSDEVIAHHKNVPRLVLTIRLYARMRNLDAEDVLNEYDISKEALEFDERTPTPMPPATIMGNQDSDSTLSSSFSESDMPPVFPGSSRKRSSGKDVAKAPKKKARLTESEISSPTPPISPSALHDLMNIEDPATGVKVKRLHKIFPAMTVPVCESVLLKNKSNFDEAIEDLDGLQNASTPTDTTVSGDAQPAMLTRSRRMKAQGQKDMLRTPSPTRTKSPSAFQLATPSNDHSPTSYGYPTPETPSMRAPIATSFNHPIPQTPSPKAPTNPVTTVSFFLANSAMGAVPIPFASIKSKNKFFNEAIAAHFLCSQSISDADNESVVAVSVAVSGVNHPIVVRRNDGGAAWNEVGRVVKEMEKMGMGVEVEVRCVVLPVVDAVGKRHKIAPRGY
ncbi:MAG: hypothetical protein Q9176_007173 [Flavoplaca citrina]